MYSINKLRNLIILIFLIPFTLSAEIYQCEDANKKIIFTDIPCDLKKNTSSNNQSNIENNSISDVEYPAEYLLNMVSRTNSYTDVELLDKVLAVKDVLINKFEMPESKKERFENIQPSSIYYSNADLIIDGRNKAINKVIIVNGNVDIRAVTTNDSIIIASGKVKYSSHNKNNIIISGSNIHMGHDNGSLAITKGGVDLVFCKNTTVYAVDGVVVSQTEKNIALYNTKKHLMSNYEKRKIPNFLMSPLFMNEPTRELENSSFTHSDSSTYESQFYAERQKSLQKSRKEGKALRKNKIINKVNDNEYRLPAITASDIRNFSSYLLEKYKCEANKPNEMRTSDLICVSNVEYWNVPNSYMIELWITAGGGNSFVKSAFSTDSPKSHYQYLAKLYDSLEDKWGTSPSRKTWKPGIMQREILEYFKGYDDVEAINHALSSCTMLVVNAAPAEGNVLLGRSENGNVKPTPSKHHVRKYLHEDTFANQELEVNESRNTLKRTKCLNPNQNYDHWPP